MRRARNLPHSKQEGSALILSLIFIAMFSALAAAMANMSGTNVQIAENQRKLDNTRACADSGLEIMRYWMSKVEMSGTTSPGQRFTELATSLQTELYAIGAQNIVPVLCGSTISVSDVPLTSNGQSFSAVLTSVDTDTVRLDVTGQNDSLSRTIRTNYNFVTQADTVFDYGVASRGPISLSGNVELEGANIEVESNAYIESLSSLLALEIIGNSHIAGTVKIVNPSAYVNLQGGQAGIGGDTGEAAMDHVDIGVPPSDFPEMNSAPFISFFSNPVTAPLTYTLSAADDTSADASYVNLKIPANMNPTFSGHSTLQGIIYIESPNVVTFTGGVDMTAVIVTDGSETDNSGTNRIDFQGNVASYPVETLSSEDQHFDFVRDQTGTFMMAPGFQASFGGSFALADDGGGGLVGAIAANGVEFYGNAGGTIRGSIINYSDTEMILSGNSDLYFNRSGLTEVPAGFVPEIVMQYDATSYCEVI